LISHKSPVHLSVLRRGADAFIAADEDAGARVDGPVGRPRRQHGGGPRRTRLSSMVTGSSCFNLAAI